MSDENGRRRSWACMEDMHTALAMRVYNVCLLYFRARVAVGIEGRNGLMGNERDRRCPSNSSSKTQRMPPLIAPPSLAALRLRSPLSLLSSLLLS